MLALDADEALSPELRASLARLEAAGTRNRRSPIKWPLDRIIWADGSGTRAGIPSIASAFTGAIARAGVGALHESVHADGPIGKLDGDLLHYTIGSVAEHYAKMEAYTNRAAEDLYARGRRRWRGGMWVAAPWTLLQRFLLQLGFLDGYRGAIIAWTSARYVWMKYRKLGVLVRGGKLEQRPWPQAKDA